VKNWGAKAPLHILTAKYILDYLLENWIDHLDPVLHTEFKDDAGQFSWLPIEPKQRSVIVEWEVVQSTLPITE
jgi:hypothetical protein